MEASEVVQVISSLYPILIGLTTLIFILSKIWVDVEALKEQVRQLFAFHNKEKEKDKKK
jgi:hypothetical protein|tara:strand:- start:621 stop:797 length:177 start_codon:yes stop_codon:yes gene_type:complete